MHITLIIKYYRKITLLKSVAWKFGFVYVSMHKVETLNGLDFTRNIKLPRWCYGHKSSTGTVGSLRWCANRWNPTMSVPFVTNAWPRVRPQKIDLCFSGTGVFIFHPRFKNFIQRIVPIISSNFFLNLTQKKSPSPLAFVFFFQKSAR